MIFCHLLTENIFAGNLHIFFEWFETISRFEKLLCISETTKKAVGNFMGVFFPERLQKIKIESFLLGNEIPNTDVSLGQPQEARIVRELLEKEQVFLMVGTLEPRKGHDELIDVLDIVWGKGEEEPLCLWVRWGGMLKT